MLDRPVAKAVHAAMDGKVEIRLLLPPFHRRDHALFAEDEKAHATAIEGRRLIQKRLDGLPRRAAAIASEKLARSVLPIDWEQRRRGSSASGGDG